ncbi:MAG: hypothetical protein K9G62_00760 [Alphaproteobacteria bacterium]|nr:hypothetical protein [Alphaproteobacteria bacterium]
MKLPNFLKGLFEERSADTSQILDVDPVYQSQQSRERLLKGIKKRSVDLIIQAVNEGADPNLGYDARIGGRDGYECETRAYEICSGDEEAMRRLHAKGADFSLSSSITGDKAVHCAALKPDNVGVLSFLKSIGMRFDAANIADRSALFYAVTTNPSHSKLKPSGCLKNASFIFDTVREQGGNFTSEDLKISLPAFSRLGIRNGRQPASF